VSWLVLVGAGCVLGWLIGLVPNRWELQVLREIVRIRSPALTDAAKAITLVGSLIVLLPLAAAGAVVLVIRRRTADLVALVVKVGGIIGCVNVIKVIVGRPRPPVPHLTPVQSASFPSQHAAQAVTTLVGLALLLSWRRLKIAACVVTSAVALAVGLSRVYLGVHYPTDVTVGWLLGVAWLVLVPRASDDAVPRGRPSRRCDPQA
jgi:undecaprenyl-diphosphatase